jgi:hypothetical protein
MSGAAFPASLSPRKFSMKQFLSAWRPLLGGVVWLASVVWRHPSPFLFCLAYHLLVVKITTKKKENRSEN